MSRGAHVGSAVSRRWRVAIISSIVSSKNFNVGRNFQRLGRGTMDGTPRMSSGSMRPDRIEIRGHCRAHIVRIAAETIREDGAFKHVNSNARCLVGEVHHLAFTSAEPID